METWRAHLRYDPISPLLASGNAALEYFVRRDLLDEDPGPANRLWELPEAQKILKKQRADGSFAFPAGKDNPVAVNYPLIETWKQFRHLVEVYGWTKDTPPAECAADLIFSRQAAAG